MTKEDERRIVENKILKFCDEVNQDMQKLIRKQDLVRYFLIHQDTLTYEKINLALSWLYHSNETTVNIIQMIEGEEK